MDLLLTQNMTFTVLTCAYGVSQPNGLTSHASLLPWNTQAQKKKRKKNHVQTALHNTNSVIRESHIHIENTLTQLYTYFSRHEEDREESPLHIEVFSLRKPAKHKCSDRAVFDHSRQFSSQSVNHPKYTRCSYIENCSLSELSIPSDQQV